MPRDLAPAQGFVENSDNEIEDNEPLVLTAEEQVAVRATHIRGGRGRKEDQEDAQLKPEDVDFDPGSRAERTQQMFQISKDVWLPDGPAVLDPNKVQHHQAFQAKPSIEDPRQVMEAVKKAKNKARDS